MWGAGPSFAEKVREDVEETGPEVFGGNGVEREGDTVVVLDTNAFVKGLRVAHLADRAVTVPEVIHEIRDPKARKAATDPALLPLGGLTLREPTDDAMRAVKKFAAQTGDLHVLAGADLRLIALAYTLEAETVGIAHLRTEPPKRQATTRQSRSASKALPGWGSVANPEDWAEVDAANAADAELLKNANAGAATSAGGSIPLQLGTLDSAQSHISTGVLDLSQALPGDLATGGAKGAAEAEAGPNTLEAAGGETAHQHPGAMDDDDEGGWERNCSRRVKRKHKRRELRAADDAEAASIAPPPDDAADLADVQAPEGEEAPAESPQAPSTTGQAEHIHSALHIAVHDYSVFFHKIPKGSNAEMEEDEAGAVAAADAEMEAAEEEEENPFDTPDVEVESRVSIITGDFAMQNVILQMGLRLLTPDGMRITNVQRFAFRCEACFYITLQAGKMFCPKCGNGGTMKKVTMQVDKDGVMQFGVRRRHNIRGTRYSLPAPKGGREGAKAMPILREDQLAKAGYKKAGVEADDFSCFEGAAAHHTLGTTSQFDVIDRRNPNVRKARATNRRRK